MIYLQYLLPHYIINKLAKFLGNCSINWVKKLLIKFFLQSYPINLQEALNHDPLSYKNYNDFFTRKLNPQARIIDPDLNIIISPCDGYIAQYGIIGPEIFMQAKETKLSLSSLLANNYFTEETSRLLENFIHGKFINIYLAPHNYHRVHMPITADLKNMLYIPGKLFSVNPKTVSKIPNVFSNNERVINIFDSEIGQVVVILIGAMIVGSIVTSWHGEVTPNKRNNLQMSRKLPLNKPHNMQSWNYTDKKVPLSKGEELGYFQLGSTVIVLFENKNLNFTDNIQNNTSIKMGEKILRIIA